MIPPNFDALGAGLVDAALQTIAIGVVSTAIGVVLSIPVGILAARNVTPRTAPATGPPGPGSWRCGRFRN